KHVQWQNIDTHAFPGRTAIQGLVYTPVHPGGVDDVPIVGIYYHSVYERRLLARTLPGVTAIAAEVQPLRRGDIDNIGILRVQSDFENIFALQAHVLPDSTPIHALEYAAYQRTGVHDRGIFGVDRDAADKQAHPLSTGLPLRTTVMCCIHSVVRCPCIN